jgi:hypothetical protein
MWTYYITMQDLHESLLLKIGAKLGPHDRARLTTTCKGCHEALGNAPETFPGVTRAMLDCFQDISPLEAVHKDIQDLLQLLDVGRFFAAPVSEVTLCKGMGSYVQHMYDCQLCSADMDKPLRLMMYVPDAFGLGHMLYVYVDPLECLVVDDEDRPKDAVPIAGTDWRALCRAVAERKEELQECWRRYESAMVQIHEEARVVMDPIVAAYPMHRYRWWHRGVYWCHRQAWFRLNVQVSGTLSQQPIEMGVYDGEACNDDFVFKVHNPRWSFDRWPAGSELFVRPDLDASEQVKLIGLLLRLLPGTRFRVFDSLAFWRESGAAPRHLLVGDVRTAERFQGLDDPVEPWWEVDNGCLMLK